METDQNFIVQEVLEKTTAWLNETRVLNLLQDNEVSAIVKTRTDYEYKLLATQRTKDLYLRYAQFELNLLTLVKTRMEMLGVRMLDRHLEALRHVESIFKRAIRLDPKDVYMWKTFVDFSVRYNFRVGDALEGAVRTNPMSPDIWILAAKWQLEVNQSEESARYLFQRAVKLNKESEKLWLEFFKLESILARAEISDGAEVEVTPELTSKYQDERAQWDLYAIPMLIYKQVTNATTLKDSYDLRFKMLHVLSQLEYTNHLQNFILKDILASFRENEHCIFECVTIELNRAIAAYKLVEKTNNNEDEHEDEKKKNMNEAIASLYQTGVKTLESLLNVIEAIPTRKMWLLYSRLCLKLFHFFYQLAHPEVKLEEEESSNEGAASSPSLSEYYLSFWSKLMNEIYPSANKNGLMGPEMIYDYCNLLKSCPSKRNLLIDILDQACNKLYSQDADLWILYMIVSEGTKMVVDQAISKFITGPIIARDSKEFEHQANQQVKFWKHVLQYVKNWASHLTMKEIDQYFVQAIKYCSHSHEMKKLYFKFYSKIYQFEGKTEAIRLKKKYEKLDLVIQMLLSLPPNSAQVYRMLIAYFAARYNPKQAEDKKEEQDTNEDEDMSDSDDDDNNTQGEFNEKEKSEQMLMKLYSRAITDHGKDEEDFWLHYIVMMKRKGKITKAQNLHYQATKTLRDSKKVQAFTEKYDLLK